MNIFLKEKGQKESKTFVAEKRQKETE